MLKKVRIFLGLSARGNPDKTRLISSSFSDLLSFASLCWWPLLSLFSGAPLYFLLALIFSRHSPLYLCLFLFSSAFLSPYSAYFGALSNFLARFSGLALRLLLLVFFFWSLGLFLFILFSLKTLSPQTWIITISSRGQGFGSAGIVALRVDQKLQNTENYCTTSTSQVWFPTCKTRVANYLLTRLHIYLPTWSPHAMPNCVPAVRYTEARHSNMRTSLSSADISWRTLMVSKLRMQSRLLSPSPPPFHYVMAKIVPVVQLAVHAKSSTLYGRSYGRTVVRS